MYTVAEQSKEEIAKLKTEELEKMYELYHMARAERIASYGKDLLRLEEEIERRSLEELPLEKLYDIKDRTQQRLADLYYPLDVKAPEPTLESLLDALCAFIERTQRGEKPSRLELQALQTLGKILGEEEISKMIGVLKYFMDTKPRKEGED